MNPMTTKIDYDYFEWLVSQIAVPYKKRNKSYNGLFEMMHNEYFHWTVPNDDNRIQDGLDLRLLFLNGKARRLTLPEHEATMLEILIALSQRVAFTGGGTPGRWAWTLLRNLQLHLKSDPLRDEDVQEIYDILEALIWRTYQPDGRGGFFPLKYPEEDQTKVEIWFQMNKYVIERDLL
jgi:hypothetical protein